MSEIGDLRINIAALEAERALLLEWEKLLDKAYWAAPHGSKRALVLGRQLDKVNQRLDDISDMLGALNIDLDDEENDIAMAESAADRAYGGWVTF